MVTSGWYSRPENRGIWYESGNSLPSHLQVCFLPNSKKSFPPSIATRSLFPADVYIPICRAYPALSVVVDASQGLRPMVLWISQPLRHVQIWTKQNFLLALSASLITPLFLYICIPPWIPLSFLRSSFRPFITLLLLRLFIFSSTRGLVLDTTNH